MKIQTSIHIAHNSCLGEGRAFTRDGIYVKNSEQVDIEDNHCSWFSYGIDLYGAGNATVANNTLDHNSIGVGLSSNANYAEIRRNELSENREGMNIQQSSHANINNNTFRTNRDYGIYMSSESSDILDKYIHGSYEGIVYIPQQRNHCDEKQGNEQHRWSACGVFVLGILEIQYIQKP